MDIKNAIIYRILRTVYWTARSRVKGVLNNVKDREIWRHILHVARVHADFSVQYLLLKVRLSWLHLLNPERKVLVISLVEHFGDIVACEPISRHMRKKHPGAYIIWCVSQPYRELVDSNPNVNYTLCVCCVIEWMRFAKTSLFDEIVDLHIDNRLCHRCQQRLNKFSGNMGVTQQNYYEYGNLLHIFSKCAGLECPQESPNIYICKSTIAKINGLRLAAPYAVIHCISENAKRNWRVQGWEELVKWLYETQQIHVIEVGLNAALSSSGTAGYTELCGKLSLLETAEVIRRAKLFIGIDSGPAHLANAVGTKGVILIGQYEGFSCYMPYSGRYTQSKYGMIIYVDGPVRDISVNEVQEVVLSMLGS